MDASNPSSSPSWKTKKIMVLIFIFGAKCVLFKSYFPLFLELICYKFALLLLHFFPPKAIFGY